MTIVKLTETQLSELTHSSSRGYVVSLKFGAGWIGLEDIPSNDWAFDLLTTPKSKVRSPDNGKD